MALQCVGLRQAHNTWPLGRAIRTSLGPSSAVENGLDRPAHAIVSSVTVRHPASNSSHPALISATTSTPISSSRRWVLSWVICASRVRPPSELQANQVVVAMAFYGADLAVQLVARAGA